MSIADTNPFAHIDSEREEIAALTRELAELKNRLFLMEELMVALLTKKRILRQVK